jgi:hypothetical protein
MNVEDAANVVTVVLTPFLTLLPRAGERAAEEAGARIGADAWALAKQLWSRLQGRTESDDALGQATAAVAAVPADPAAQAALRGELRRIFAADTGLLNEITDSLVPEGQEAHLTNIAHELNIGINTTGPIVGSHINATGKQSGPRR